MTIASIADGEAGSSVRTKLNLVIDDVNGVVQNITAGAVSPGPNINVLADIVYVTSAGTAGDEYINMPPGSPDPTQMGHLVRVVYLAPTDPADVVHVLFGGSGDFAPLSPVGATYPPGSTILGYRVANGVEFKYEGDGTAFTRGYGTFYWTPWITGFSDEQVSRSSPVIIKTIDQPAGTGQAAKDITLQAGSSPDTDAGSLILTGGNADGNAYGGGVVISGGYSDGSATVDKEAGDIILQAGVMFGAGSGGVITLTAGASHGGNGGNVAINSGPGYGGVGGNISVTAGGSLLADGNGGSIEVTAGSAGASGFGGSLSFVSGAGNAGSGSVSIQSANSSAGQAGNVTIQVGTSGGPNKGQVVMPTLPTADPVFAGALWNNAGVLSVSAGP